jgi:hypothetical protein
MWIVAIVQTSRSGYAPTGFVTACAGPYLTKREAKTAKEQFDATSSGAYYSRRVEIHRLKKRITKKVLCLEFGNP